MHKSVTFTFLLISGLVLVGCSDSPNQEQDSIDVQPGEYYTFRCFQKDYKVLKVIVADESLIHVCYYNNVFEEKPTEDVVPSLYFGNKLEVLGQVLFVTEGEQATTGRKHIALTLENWEYWEPQFLCSGKVTPDELVGYEQWKNGKRFVNRAKILPGR